MLIFKKFLGISIAGISGCILYDLYTSYKINRFMNDQIHHHLYDFIYGQDEQKKTITLTCHPQWKKGWYLDLNNLAKFVNNTKYKYILVPVDNYTYNRIITLSKNNDQLSIKLSD